MFMLQKLNLSRTFRDHTQLGCVQIVYHAFGLLNETMHLCLLSRVITSFGLIVEQLGYRDMYMAVKKL